MDEIKWEYFLVNNMFILEFVKCLSTVKSAL